VKDSTTRRYKKLSGGVKMPDIAIMKSMNVPEKIAITKHAKERLEERGIKVNDVISCIESGEIIEQYEDDRPLPSCLILGTSAEGKRMHVVVSNDTEFIYLITAYYPDPEQWENDFKTRKRC
jgi:hypothetical protein